MLVIGLGDLGRRIARRLAVLPPLEELVLAGRTEATGRSFAALIDACGPSRTRFVQLDAADQAACERVLAEVAPDIVVQCAVAVSPWRVAAVQEPRRRRAATAGFAVQLPFQLAIARTVMLAARAIGFSGAVVNCSYPDVTNAVLARQGLAPTIGIGNVGMMQARVEAVVRGTTGATPLVRVIAQHAQTVRVMRSDAPSPEARPWVFIGETGDRADHLAYDGAPIAWDIDTNELTAATAIPVIGALLPNGTPVRASVPGPLGLLGGYPVHIAHGRIDLDLPPGISRASAEDYNLRMGRLDGLLDLLPDGTAVYTTDVAARLADLDPELAAPLSSSDHDRAARLARALEVS